MKTDSILINKAEVRGRSYIVYACRKISRLEICSRNRQIHFVRVFFFFFFCPCTFVFHIKFYGVV